MNACQKLLLVALAGVAIPSAWAQDPPAPAEPAPNAAQASAAAAAPSPSQPDLRSTAPNPPEEQVVGPVRQPEEQKPATAGGKEVRPDPYVLGKVPSVWWALGHPTQAWKVLEPVQ